MFFADPENKKKITSFLSKADRANIEDEIQKRRLSKAKQIIDYIYNKPDEWDKHCDLSRVEIGSSFLSNLNTFDSSNPIKIDDIFSSAYQFLCEFVFWTGIGKMSNDIDDREMIIKLNKLKEEIQKDNDNMSENARSSFIYANYYMPADIIKRLINNNKFDSFLDFENLIVKAQKLKEEWDKKFEEKKR